MVIQELEVILGSDPTDDEIQELIDTIGTGNEDWSSSDQYAAAYLALGFSSRNQGMQDIQMASST